MKPLKELKKNSKYSKKYFSNERHYRVEFERTSNAKKTEGKGIIMSAFVKFTELSSRVNASVIFLKLNEMFNRFNLLTD